MTARPEQFDNTFTRNQNQPDFQLDMADPSFGNDYRQATSGFGAGKVEYIDYPDGSHRAFVVDQNRNVLRFVNTDGKLFTRNADGNWVNEKGEDMGWRGLRLNEDGSLLLIQKGGMLARVGRDGKQEVLRIDESDRFYPSDRDRDGERARIQQYLQEHPLNKQGHSLLNELHQLGLDDVDLFHGRPVQVNGDGTNPGDNGALYEQWRTKYAAQPRGSSHYSSAQQYQIPLGIGNAVLLFGKDEAGNTWFQIEKSNSYSYDPRDFFSNLPGASNHLRDANLSHYLGGQSIGPLGFSDKPAQNIGYRR